MQVLYKAAQGKLPRNLQTRFIKRETKHNLRGVMIFKKTKVRTTLKAMTITVNGVNQWNSLQEETRCSGTMKVFQKRMLKMTFDGYGYDNICV